MAYFNRCHLWNDNEPFDGIGRDCYGTVLHVVIVSTRTNHRWNHTFQWLTRSRGSYHLLQLSRASGYHISLIETAGFCITRGRRERLKPATHWCPLFSSTCTMSLVKDTRVWNSLAFSSISLSVLLMTRTAGSRSGPSMTAKGIATSLPSLILIAFSMSRRRLVGLKGNWFRVAFSTCFLTSFSRRPHIENILMPKTLNWHPFILKLESKLWRVPSSRMLKVNTRCGLCTP